MTKNKAGEVPAKVRGALRAGRLIAVVGWRNSDHDDFTRSLSDKQIAFVGNTMPSGNPGFTLLTTVVNSQLRGRATHRRPAAPALYDPSQIKEILRACADLLRIRPHAAPGAPVAPAQKGHLLDADPLLLDFLTQPQRELSVMEKFAAAFLAEAAKGHGLVGKQTLGKLIRAHKVDSAQVLARDGWIQGAVSEGRRRIGQYRPTKKLEQLANGAEQLPEDPLARVQHLIAQKQALLAEQAELDTKRAQIAEKLTTIARAEGLLDQLGQLLKKDDASQETD